MPCLIEYAEQKSRQATTDSPDFNATAFADPWTKCLSCHQPYQNKLALNLGCAFVSFVDATYGHTEDMTWDKLRVLTALQAKIEQLVKLDENRTECLTNLDRMLSMINQIVTKLKMSRWIFESQDSFEYKFYVTLYGEYEAQAFEIYGILIMSVNTVTGYTQALSHFKKASIIYRLLLSRTESEEIRHNLSVQSKRMEDKIDLIKNLLADLTNSGEDRNMDKFSELEKAKKEYEDSIKSYGLNSLQALYNGLTYVKIMQHVNHFIKAERFLTDLVARSRLVHGPEHMCTLEADTLLTKCKTRYVAIKPKNEGVNDIDNKKDAETFQALRYENNDEICVVTGPIKQPRHKDDENTFGVEIQRIYPLIGCPVMVMEFERGRHYVERVQARFVNEPHIHEAFLGIMDEWESIGVPSVLEQVSTLFADHRDLLLDFTKFLPQEIRNEAFERLNQAASEAVTKGTTVMELEQQQDGVVGGSSDVEPNGILGTVIGHITDVDISTELLVHFPNMTLKDMCIKPENVRIVFELPDKDA